MPLTTIMFLLGALILGSGVGYYLRFIISIGKRGSMELEIKQMELEAKEKAKKTVLEAEHKAAEILQESRKEGNEREEKLQTTEERLIKKEDILDKRQGDLDKEVDSIKNKANEIREIKDRADKLIVEREKALEATSGLSVEEAKNKLIKETETRYADDLMVRMRKLENGNHEQLDLRARNILATAIQRFSGSVTADVFSSSVTIPSEDVKGKIIGKEGRNIKVFERMTGVEVLVDESPGFIVLSSFDPVRRAIAKVALEKLILDGRIQPAKIEKTIEEAKAEINKIIEKRGEEAAFECGVMNLDRRVLMVLGRLHFRTSYGQNVLQHSIEMTHIAGMIAQELGANVAVAKAGALVHDIGKALDHEVQGTHVEIGRRVLQKFNTDEAIIKAMQAHHEEYPFETVESVIVQVADHISGSRPGARRDSVEQYIKRLEDLESIATGFPTVERAYALQAGREIRIFVTPEKCTDIEAANLAHDVAKKIEDDLKYPGEIKVTVIRETRITDYAR